MSDKIKTILYATDLGEHTRPAFHMTVNLAKVHGAKVIFVYVVEPLSSTQVSAISVYFPTDALAEHNARSIDEIRSDIHDRIKAFTEAEMKGEEFPGGEPELHVIEGIPDVIIVKTAEKLNADVIVMGSHSHGPLSKLFIGSVANKVVNHSTIPVLLVPTRSH